MNYPAISGAYNNQVIDNDTVITLAFKNLGIAGESLDIDKMNNGLMNLSLLMTEWINNRINLWTLQIDYLGLVTNLGNYKFPNYISDISAVRNISYDRILGGISFCEENNYNNAFDGDERTIFTTNDVVPLYYIYQAVDESFFTEKISLFGIFPVGEFPQNTQSVTYTLFATNDLPPDELSNWKQLAIITRTQDNLIEQPMWANVNIPGDYKVYKIESSHQFSVSEVILANNVRETPLYKISRSDFSFATTHYFGMANRYYVDRQIQPVMYLLPTPNINCRCLKYYYKRLSQDPGNYTNACEIPSRLYPALIWGLSWRLSVIYKPEDTDRLEGYYMRSYSEAAIEDSESTPLTISVNLRRYYD